MKLEKNIKNIFNCTIIKNNIEFVNKQISIEYFITKDKKYYYKIISDECLENFFTSKYVEGVKGFGQHVISNDIFHLSYKEKNSQLELITWNNSVFIYGILLT